MSFHAILSRDYFSDDSDLLELFTAIAEGLVGRVLGDESYNVVFFIIVYALDGCFIIDQDHGDLAVINGVLSFDKEDVAVEDACVYHRVALCGEAKIGVNVGIGFDIRLVLLVCEYRLSAGYVAEHGELFLSYGAGGIGSD